MTPQQRELYERLTTGPRAQSANLPLAGGDAPVIGPAVVWLARPPLGLAVERLGAAVRFESLFTPRQREIATLLVANHHDSAFERYAHERLARTAGLSDDEVAALATGTPPPLTDEVEQTVAATTVLLLETGQLTDADYDAAVRVLGVERLVELVTLVGYYGLLALQLRVFQIAPPSDI
jgi:alkylhydroperoxidase family enzyme